MKAESFSPQALCKAYGQKKEHHDSCDAPDGFLPNTRTKRSHVATVPSVRAIAEYQILGGKHFLHLGPESGKIWWLKKVQYLQKKYHCRWTLLHGKQPKMDFS